METIKHIFHINAPQPTVFKAISTVEGFKNWWVVKVNGVVALEKEIQFTFGENAVIKFKAIVINKNETIEYICVEGHPEWVNTLLKFSLSRNEEKTHVTFEHSKWKEATDFMANCNFSWGRYLVSLRNYCETGIGQPFEGIN